MKFQHPEGGVVEANPQNEADHAALIGLGLVPIEEDKPESKPERKPRKAL